MKSASFSLSCYASPLLVNPPSRGFSARHLHRDGKYGIIRITARTYSGDVPKWLKGPHSKCGRRVTARESSNLSISATSEQAKMLAPTLFSQNDTGIRFAAAFLYIGLVCAHLHSFENTVYCNIQPFSLTGSHFRDGERGIQCPLPEKSILPGWQAAVWPLSCASCCGHTDGTLSRCWTG